MSFRDHDDVPEVNLEKFFEEAAKAKFTPKEVNQKIVQMFNFHLEDMIQEV